MTILKVFILKCEKKNNTFLSMHLLPKKDKDQLFSFKFLKFTNKFSFTFMDSLFFSLFSFFSVEETRREVEMIT